MLPYFDRSEISRILDVIVHNSQIWDASGMPSRIQVIFSWLWRNDRDRVDVNVWFEFWVTMKDRIRNDDFLADLYSGLHNDLVNASIVSGSDTDTDQ